MVNDKTCNKCKKKNLGWDYEFHKKTKKWKLENHRRQDGKWCNKPPENKYEDMPKKKDFIKCNMCPSSYGWCLTVEAKKKNPEWAGNTFEEHRNLFHKWSTRELTENDFKVNRHYTTL
jgi:hypothetical protein